jgi:hypothetical protein
MNEKKIPYETNINHAVLDTFIGNNQIFFTIDELMHIYSSNSDLRRKLKDHENKQELKMGNLPFNATKLKSDVISLRPAEF